MQHQHPPPCNTQPQGGAPLVDLLRSRLAHRALQLLVDDEDDLFYTQGRYHSTLMEAMVRRGWHGGVGWGGVWMGGGAGLWGGRGTSFERRHLLNQQAVVA